MDRHLWDFRIASGFEKPRSGWPKPLRIPRPGEKPEDLEPKPTKPETDPDKIRKFFGG